MPLQFFLEWCRSSGTVPDWPGFVEDALAMGWGLGTTLARVEEGCADVFGRDHAREVSVRLKAYVARRGDPGRGAVPG